MSAWKIEESNNGIILIRRGLEEYEFEKQDYNTMMLISITIGQKCTTFNRYGCAFHGSSFINMIWYARKYDDYTFISLFIAKMRKFKNFDATHVLDDLWELWRHGRKKSNIKIYNCGREIIISTHGITIGIRGVMTTFTKKNIFRYAHDYFKRELLGEEMKKLELADVMTGLLSFDIERALRPLPLPISAEISKHLL